MIFGGAIHKAIELCFQRKLEGESQPDIDELCAAFWSEWELRASAEVRFGKGETMNSIAAMGESILKAAVEKGLPALPGNIIGIEEEIMGPVIDGCPPLLGRVDLLLDRDDELVVVDLKTARNRWSAGQAFDSAEQLLLYGEFAKGLIPGKRLRLQFAVLTKAKSPDLQLIDIPVEIGRVIRTKSQMHEIWKSIQSGVVYANPSPINCYGCPFQTACRHWLANGD